MRQLALILAIPLWAAASLAAAEGVGRITVTGEGRVAAAPDMATVSLGVTSQAETAKAAMDQTSSKVAMLFETLAAAGIEPRDVQTTGLSLNPVWDNRSYDSGAPRIAAFAAVNTVTVRVRDLDGLGPLLDGLLESGANTFNGLSFGLQEPGPKRDEARAAAVADAKATAELLAGSAGVSLGAILSIVEDPGPGGPQPMFRMEAAMAADSVPVAGGELEVAARVTIVWEIEG